MLIAADLAAQHASILYERRPAIPGDITLSLAGRIDDLQRSRPERTFGKTTLHLILVGVQRAQPPAAFYRETCRRAG